MTELFPAKPCGLKTVLSTTLQATTPNWSRLPREMNPLFPPVGERQWGHLGLLPESPHLPTNMFICTSKSSYVRTLHLNVLPSVLFRAESSSEAWLKVHLHPRRSSDAPSPHNSPLPPSPRAGFYHTMEPCARPSSFVPYYFSLLY